MSKTTGTKIGALEADNLIARVWPPAETQIIDLKTPGAYQRGTLLSFESDGAYEVLGSGSGTASCILAAATEAEDTTAEAYISGNFYRGALIAADSYTLTPEDENNLRLAGILLSDDNR